MDKHHIVPKHMGGLGPGHPQEHLNIMELSREDHAWAHFILYKLYGHDEDLWAAAQLGHPQADISGDKNPMANPIHRATYDEAMSKRTWGDEWSEHQKVVTKDNWTKRRKKYGPTGGNVKQRGIPRPGAGVDSDGAKRGWATRRENIL